MSEWISVKDRLPELGTDVLCFDQLEGMHVQRLEKDTLCGTVWFDYYDQGINLDWVTHWMPLPEPPKEEE